MRRRTADPIKFCAQCGALMVRKRTPNGELESLLAFSRRRFCDRRCMALHMTGVIKVQNERNSHRQSAKTVGECCENCGRHDSRLHVHHQDGNAQNNALSNLKTLCGSCHQLAHTQLSGKTPQRLRPCIYCSRPARHRGLCNTHYSRWRRRGNALVVKQWNGHGEAVYLTEPTKS